MIWVDYAILGIVALSAVIGLFRGFTREAIGLATWILAFFVAYKLAEPVAVLLEEFISARSVRLAAAFGALFIVVLIIGAIVNYTVSKLVNKTGFAGTDRALGSIFGVLRGIGVLIILVLLAGVTAVPKDAWWEESIFIGRLEEGAIWVRDWLPTDLAEEIEFGPVIRPEPETELAPGSERDQKPENESENRQRLDTGAPENISPNSDSTPDSIPKSTPESTQA